MSVYRVVAHFYGYASSCIPDGVTTRVKTPTGGRFAQLEVKKDGVEIIKWPYLLIMFPQFYQNYLEKQLKPVEYLTLKILVYLLQSHRQVCIELLASVMPYLIQFESLRRSLQRFLKLDCLNYRKSVVSACQRNLNNQI
jgi:hypothetical protein